MRTVQQRPTDRRRQRTAFARLPSEAGPSAPAPALLADATSYGALAAVRDLGARGIPVIVAYDDAMAPARYSRYAESTIPCPKVEEPERFLEWLHDFGARSPGRVLCPTSDELAFLVASNLDSLAPLYRLFSPSRDALLQMLDKSRLVEAADRAGLKSPRTWSPRDEHELDRLARDVPLPVCVKPRTHLLSQGLGKPVVIRRRAGLAPAWRAMRRAGAHHADHTGIPGAELPILQACHGGTERVYTLDGFVDNGGTILGATACVKTLQLPRRSGPGICFETAEVDPELRSGLQRLCRQAGYRGVFDAEFLIDGDEKLLIDFNPRFYHHMAFEVERNLPLPWLAYLAAVGDERALRRAMATLAVDTVSPGRIYAHRFLLVALLGTQRLTGRMTSAEVKAWREWIRGADGLTNPAYVPGDPLPALAEIAYWLRHPRWFLRRAAAA